MAIPFAVRIPFVEQIGCELQHFENGEAEVTLVLQEDRHTNSFGVAHGGLMMTLLDVAMAHAARSLNLNLPDGGPGIVTIEMKTTFMRPGVGTIRALGSVLHSTASLAFTEGKVLDEKGRLCAHATATFKFLRGLAVSDREIRPAAKPLLSGPGSD
jgi:uncharacterized protein (TIGR00369 family)